jgi:hypothetical protein
MSESKEDDPTTASRNDYAQSECHFALYSNSVTYPLRELRLIVLLFQENKSFGASTICIHPLMYGKPCREQYTP